MLMAFNFDARIFPIRRNVQHHSCSCKRPITKGARFEIRYSTGMDEDISNAETDAEQCTGGLCLMPQEEHVVGSDKADKDDGNSDAATENGTTLPQNNESVGNNETKPNKSNRKKKNSEGVGGIAVIKKVHSQKELETLIASHEAVVVEFMTTWCGACKGIEPLYEELSVNAPSVQSLQIICDKNKETKKIASSFGVGSYPVFHIFEDGRPTTQWKGADRGKLEKAFDRLQGGGRGGKGKKGRKQGR